MIDKPSVSKRTETKRGLLATIAATLIHAAQRAGGSLHHHPMPELREVGREWRLGTRS
jgi:hypothetical protein